MNNNEIKDRLIAVFNTINNIEVKGQSNICNMAGCIQILQDVLNTMAANESKANAEPEPAEEG
jgi:hypothetical protein